MGSWLLVYILWGGVGDLEIKETRFNSELACTQTIAFMKKNYEDDDESLARNVKLNPNYTRRDVDAQCILDKAE